MTETGGKQEPFYPDSGKVGPIVAGLSYTSFLDRSKAANILAGQLESGTDVSLTVVPC